MSYARIKGRAPWLDKAILLGAFLVYVGGYAAMRSEHVLVHTISFSQSTDALGPVLTHHGIVPGDAGEVAEGPATEFATLLARVIYWPMTKAELGYWYIVEPAGSPYDAPAPPALAPELSQTAPRPPAPPVKTPP